MKKFEYIIGVPAFLLQSEGLQLSTRTVMIAIYDIAKFMVSENREISIPLKQISKFLNCPELPVYVALLELREAGYIELSNSAKKIVVTNVILEKNQ